MTRRLSISGILQERLLKLRQAGKPISDEYHRIGGDAPRRAANEFESVSTRSTARISSTQKDLPGDASPLFVEKSIPLVEHLDPGLDLIIRRYEPVLARRILDIRRKGWTIELGAEGSVTHARKSTRRITIDPGFSRHGAEYMVGILAHEVNHAHPHGYSAKEIAKYGRTRKDWIDAKLLERFRSEADAEIAVRDSRKRILQNGGPDIGLHFEDPAVEAIYAEHSRGKMLRADARDAVAPIYGNFKGVSSDGQEEALSISDDLEPEFAKDWDAYHAQPQA